VASFVGYGQIEGGWTAYANAVARVSTRSIGIAFAVNTAIIVLLQRVVLRRIEGRRRTRMVMLQGTLWAAAWAVLGTSGLVPATPLAGGLLVVAFGVFAVGETFQSPVLPAIRNDVAPAALRGRYNAAAAIAFQIANVSGPAVAGALLGRQHADVYIGMLIAGCVVLGVAARRLEAVLPAAANGIAAVAVADDDDPRGRRVRDAG
jgi:MFS family permease